MLDLAAAMAFARTTSANAAKLCGPPLGQLAGAFSKRISTHSRITHASISQIQIYLYSSCVHIRFSRRMADAELEGEFDENVECSSAVYDKDKGSEVAAVSLPLAERLHSSSSSVRVSGYSCLLAALQHESTPGGTQAPPASARAGDVLASPRALRHACERALGERDTEAAGIGCHLVATAALELPALAAAAFDGFTATLVSSLTARGFAHERPSVIAAAVNGAAALISHGLGFNSRSKLAVPSPATRCSAMTALAGVLAGLRQTRHVGQRAGSMRVVTRLLATGGALVLEAEPVLANELCMALPESLQNDCSVLREAAAYLAAALARHELERVATALRSLPGAGAACLDEDTREALGSELLAASSATALPQSTLVPSSPRRSPQISFRSVSPACGIKESSDKAIESLPEATAIHSAADDLSFAGAPAPLPMSVLDRLDAAFSAGSNCDDEAVCNRLRALSLATQFKLPTATGKSATGDGGASGWRARLAACEAARAELAAHGCLSTADLWTSLLAPVLALLPREPNVAVAAAALDLIAAAACRQRTSAALAARQLLPVLVARLRERRGRARDGALAAFLSCLRFNALKLSEVLAELLAGPLAPPAPPPPWHATGVMQQASALPISAEWRVNAIEVLRRALSCERVTPKEDLESCIRCGAGVPSICEALVALAANAREADVRAAAEVALATLVARLAAVALPSVNSGLSAAGAAQRAVRLVQDHSALAVTLAKLGADADAARARVRVVAEALLAGKDARTAAAAAAAVAAKGPATARSVLAATLGTSAPAAKKAATLTVVLSASEVSAAVDAPPEFAAPAVNDITGESCVTSAACVALLPRAEDVIADLADGRLILPSVPAAAVDATMPPLPLPLIDVEGGGAAEVAIAATPPLPLTPSMLTPLVVGTAREWRAQVAAVDSLRAAALANPAAAAARTAEISALLVCAWDCSHHAVATAAAEASLALAYAAIAHPGALQPAPALACRVAAAIIARAAPWFRERSKVRLQASLMQLPTVLATASGPATVAASLLLAARTPATAAAGRPAISSLGACDAVPAAAPASGAAHPLVAERCYEAVAALVTNFSISRLSAGPLLPGLCGPAGVHSPAVAVRAAARGALAALYTQMGQSLARAIAALRPSPFVNVSAANSLIAELDAVCNGGAGYLVADARAIVAASQAIAGEDAPPSIVLHGESGFCGAAGGRDTVGFTGAGSGAATIAGGARLVAVDPSKPASKPDAILLPGLSRDILAELDTPNDATARPTASAAAASVGGDKSRRPWQRREAALAAVTAALEAAAVAGGVASGESLTALVRALARRLTDSQANLRPRACAALAALARAMGNTASPSMLALLRTSVARPLLEAMGDREPRYREAATAALDAWVALPSTHGNDEISQQAMAVVLGQLGIEAATSASAGSGVAPGAGLPVRNAMREPLFLWLARRMPALQRSAVVLAAMHVPGLYRVIFDALCDRIQAVRAAAFTVLTHAVRVAGTSAAASALPACVATQSARESTQAILQAASDAAMAVEAAASDSAAISLSTAAAGAVQGAKMCAVAAAPLALSVHVGTTSRTYAPGTVAPASASASAMVADSAYSLSLPPWTPATASVAKLARLRSRGHWAATSKSLSCRSAVTGVAALAVALRAEWAAAGVASRSLIDDLFASGDEGPARQEAALRWLAAAVGGVGMSAPEIMTQTRAPPQTALLPFATIAASSDLLLKISSLALMDVRDKPATVASAAALLEAFVLRYSARGAALSRWEGDIIMPTLVERAGHRREDTRTRLGELVASFFLLLGAHCGAERDGGFGGGTGGVEETLGAAADAYLLPVAQHSRNVTARAVALGVLARLVVSGGPSGSAAPRLLRRAALRSLMRVIADTRACAALRDAALGVFSAQLAAMGGDGIAFERLLLTSEADRLPPAGLAAIRRRAAEEASSGSCAPLLPTLPPTGGLYNTVLEAAAGGRLAPLLDVELLAPEVVSEYASSARSTVATRSPCILIPQDEIEMAVHGSVSDERVSEAEAASQTPVPGWWRALISGLGSIGGDISLSSLAPAPTHLLNRGAAALVFPGGDNMLAAVAQLHSYARQLVVVAGRQLRKLSLADVAGLASASDAIAAMHSDPEYIALRAAGEALRAAAFSSDMRAAVLAASVPLLAATRAAIFAAFGGRYVARMGVPTAQAHSSWTPETASGALVDADDAHAAHVCETLCALLQPLSPASRTSSRKGADSAEFGETCNSTLGANTRGATAAALAGELGALLLELLARTSVDVRVVERGSGALISRGGASGGAMHVAGQALLARLCVAAAPATLLCALLPLSADISRAGCRPPGEPSPAGLSIHAASGGAGFVLASADSALRLDAVSLERLAAGASRLLALLALQQVSALAPAGGSFTSLLADPAVVAALAAFFECRHFAATRALTLVMARDGFTPAMRADLAPPLETLGPLSVVPVAGNGAFNAAKQWQDHNSLRERRLRNVIRAHAAADCGVDVDFAVAFALPLLAARDFVRAIAHFAPHGTLRCALAGAAALALSALTTAAEAEAAVAGSPLPPLPANEVCRRAALLQPSVAAVTAVARGTNMLVLQRAALESTVIGDVCGDAVLAANSAALSLATAPSLATCDNAAIAAEAASTAAAAVVAITAIMLRVTTAAATGAVASAKTDAAELLVALRMLYEDAAPAGSVPATDPATMQMLCSLHSMHTGGTAAAQLRASMLWQQLRVQMITADGAASRATAADSDIATFLWAATPLGRIVALSPTGPPTICTERATAAEVHSEVACAAVDGEVALLYGMADVAGGAEGLLHFVTSRRLSHTTANVALGVGPGKLRRSGSLLAPPPPPQLPQ